MVPEGLHGGRDYLEHGIAGLYFAAASVGRQRDNDNDVEQVTGGWEWEIKS